MALILVADDQEAIRNLLRLILEQAGHNVMLASNGLEAVALYRSYATRIDLLILDVKMPVMDGLEAVRRIRESKSDARIICMTGYSDDAIPEDVELIAKPFQPPNVLAAIDKLLAQPRPKR